MTKNEPAGKKRSFFMPPGRSGAVKIVLANLVPVAGVLFFHWTVFGIVTAYLVEFSVYAFFTLLRLCLLPADSFAGVRHPAWTRLLFTAGAAVFLAVFIAGFFAVTARYAPPGAGLEQVVLWTAPAAFAGYLAAFIAEHRKAGEYYFDYYIMKAGSRFMFLGFMIVAGDALALKFHNPAFFLAVFVIVKILADLAFEGPASQLYYAAFRKKPFYPASVNRAKNRID